MTHRCRRLCWQGSCAYCVLREGSRCARRQNLPVWISTPSATRKRASGSLASTSRYWYIDNKGIRLEETFRRASYRWLERHHARERVKLGEERQGQGSNRYPAGLD